MKTWTPLFGSIIDSSIWRGTKEVKILWITMLAKKDQYGIVDSTLPGLASAAGLTLEECEAAMMILESPDQYSRTTEEGGRRVRRVRSDGWLVINHLKYRDMMKPAKVERERERKRRWAAKNRKKKQQPPTESQSDQNPQP